MGSNQNVDNSQHVRMDLWFIAVTTRMSGYKHSVGRSYTESDKVRRSISLQQNPTNLSIFTSRNRHTTILYA